MDALEYQLLSSHFATIKEVQVNEFIHNTNLN